LLATKRAYTATKLARRQSGCLSHRPLDPAFLPLLSQPYSTGRASPKRYDNRYEVEGSTNFGELRQETVRKGSERGFENEFRRYEEAKIGPIKPSWRSVGLRHCCFQGFSDSFNAKFNFREF